MIPPEILPAIPPPLPPGWSGAVWRDPRQVDAGHLRLLAIFHFAFAALGLVGLAFLGLHFYFMRMMFSNPKMWQNGQEAPPPEFFQFFQWFYVFAGVLCIVAMALNAISGWCIVQRKARVFSMVVAGMNCLQIPFGTALGIFTFIVLGRDSVRGVYAERARL